MRDVVRAQDTFTYDPALTEAEVREVWVEPPPGRTVVAVVGDRVLGTAKMGTNRPRPPLPAPARVAHDQLGIAHRTADLPSRAAAGPAGPGKLA